MTLSSPAEGSDIKLFAPSADDAALVASGMSFSYNFSHFLTLRIGLLAGHPIEQHELAALEYGVQKVSKPLLLLLHQRQQQVADSYRNHRTSSRPLATTTTSWHCNRTGLYKQTKCMAKQHSSMQDGPFM